MKCKFTMSRRTVRNTRCLLRLAALFLIIPASSYGQKPGWTAVAPMSVARLGHSMVELPSGPNALGLSSGPGKVMVIGGFDSEPVAPHVPANPLASCEIYDPTTNTWTAAAPHPIPAGWRWATVVSNGMVLVVGGAKTLTTLVASSHLYDPSTNTWIATNPAPVAMFNPHVFMHPVSLPNGQVLIAGGIDQNGVNAVNKKTVPPFSQFSYLFTLNVRHPELSSWDFTRSKLDGTISPMPEGRTTSALVLMANGKVLNVGGLGPKVDGTEAATNTASIFDSATGVWNSVSPMPPVYGLGEDESVAAYPTGPGSRWAPYAQLLDNGQVLIAGGCAGLIFLSFTPRSSAIIFDPVLNGWTLTNPMLFQRPFGSWILKNSDGSGVLFAGESYSSDGTFTLHDLTGEIYAPATQQWTLAPSDGGPTIEGPAEFDSQSVQLKNGTMQVGGGADFATGTIATKFSWIYKP
jgi:hypothetical protein